MQVKCEKKDLKQSGSLQGGPEVSRKRVARMFLNDRVLIIKE